MIQPGVTAVAVDARTLQQTGKGIPRFVFEVLSELMHDTRLRLILLSNRPLHPDNELPIETVIDERWAAIPGSVWLMTRFNALACRSGAQVVWGPAHVIPPRDRRLRTVLTIHDLVYRIMPSSMGFWNRLVSRALIDRSIRHADRVIADSMTTLNDAARLIGRAPDTIDMVHLGARAASKDITLKNSDAEQSNYLFALGSIEPRKNIDGLLNCLAPLRARMPTLELRLTGAHSWGSVDTLSRIREDPACKLLGFLSDLEIARNMAAARAFIMPSHYEGFGLPIIEAVGLAPIIAADIPVFRELGRYLDGICFVDFANPDRAAAEIATFLAGNPEPTRFKPGAEANFRWPEVARRYGDVLSAH